MKRPPLNEERRKLFCLDFWSAPQEEVQLTDTVAPGTDVALPDVTLAGLPDGAVITRAVAMFKFRMVENTAVVPNAVSGIQYIRVRDDTPGTWRNAITIADDMFTLDSICREGGDMIIGNIDIAVEVDGNDTYNFQWAASLVDQANLQFNDVQTGLRIWYSV
jgi:hypothetical protein